MDENEMKVIIFNTLFQERRNPMDVAKMTNKVVSILKSGEMQ